MIAFFDFQVDRPGYIWAGAGYEGDRVHGENLDTPPVFLQMWVELYRYAKRSRFLPIAPLVISHLLEVPAVS
jgi:hypothetical protein